MTKLASTLLIFAGFLTAQSSAKKNSDAQAYKAPVDSPEHIFARTQFEDTKKELDKSKAEYNEKMDLDIRCRVFPELIRHPVTVTSVDRYTAGCKYDTRKARYVMDRLTEILALAESRLGHVDECLKTYRETIDKKISDQTTREAQQIKACQAEELYPPRAK